MKRTGDERGALTRRELMRAAGGLGLVAAIPGVLSLAACGGSDATDGASGTTTSAATGAEQAGSAPTTAAGGGRVVLAEFGGDYSASVKDVFCPASRRTRGQSASSSTRPTGCRSRSP